jgi:hypothetical protein
MENMNLVFFFVQGPGSPEPMGIGIPMFLSLPKLLKNLVDSLLSIYCMDDLLHHWLIEVSLPFLPVE